MNARFRLDPRGQLSPENAEGQGALPSRAGSYELLRTAPDLLCLLRTPPSGGRIDAPKVVLAGDAASFPLSDLIAFLSQSRWSGVVSLHEASATRSLAMKEGEVRGALTDEPSERLAELMVRLGHVTQAQVDEVLRSDPPSRLGRALVERGIIQPHDLWKCINHQVAEIFHAMVLCREGAYVLIDQPLDEKTQNIQISTNSLLMDSIRKIDEMAHFRKRIPHGRLFVAKKRPSDGTLEADEDRLLGLANGQRTVLEIATAARMGEFDATKVVFRLLEGGFASVSEHRIATPAAAAAPAQAPVAAQSRPQPVGSDAVRVVQTFNAIFRDIAREVARRQMQRELLASANAALAGKGLSSSPVLVGLNFDAEGNLPEGRLVEQFERSRAQLGSEPVAALRQALSDVMFFMLFQAGELLETNADEELATRVKSLLAVLDEG
jgi:hypothetical protein